MSALSSRAAASTLESTPGSAIASIAGGVARSRSIGIAGHWLGAAAAASLIAVGLIMAAAGLTIDPWSLGNLGVFACLVGAAVTCWASRLASGERARFLRDFAELGGLFAFFCLLGAVASYPVAALSHGYCDRMLARCDRLLRFDWIAWYDVTAAHPLLQRVSRAAYQSIFVNPVILIGYFAATDRKLEARRFIAGFWLAAVITLIAFAAFPAEGPLGFMWRGGVPYVPVSATYQEWLIPALRAHAVHHVALSGLHGLVSAPSFHTACGVMFTATAWAYRRLRWPVTLMNGAMLLATPVEGTHYLTDMLAGALVGAIALLAASLLFRQLVHSQVATIRPWR